MKLDEKDLFDLETLDSVVKYAAAKKINPFEVVCPECGKRWKAYYLRGPAEKGGVPAYLDAALFEQPISGICEDCNGGPGPQMSPFVKAKK